MSNGTIRRRRIRIRWPLANRESGYRFTRQWQQMSNIQDDPWIDYDDMSKSHKSLVERVLALTYQMNDPQISEIALEQENSSLIGILVSDLYEVIIVPSDTAMPEWSTNLLTEGDIGTEGCETLDCLPELLA